VIWVFAIFAILFVGFMMIPNAILGGIILFGLCIWGLNSGSFILATISVFFLIGLFINIFGDA